jgi:hypothetical protein
MTITVKHVIDRGNETIHVGTHVSWHEQQTSDDPQVTELTLHNRDVVVAAFRHDGAAYVVNEAGKTVGVYRLPAHPIAQGANQSYRPSQRDRNAQAVAEAIAET